MPLHVAACNNRIQAVQALTVRVQEDITEVQKMCPVTNLRAQLYMQRWGLEKFEKIMRKLQMGRLLAGFHRWHEGVQSIIKAEK